MPKTCRQRSFWARIKLSSSKKTCNLSPVHLTKLTLISSSLHIYIRKTSFLTRLYITYYLSRICTFDLVKVWIFQIQLSAYLFLNRFLNYNHASKIFFDELLLLTMLWFDHENSAVDISLFAEGQLESPVIMGSKFRKVKQFFKNNFQKNLKFQKTADFRDFLQKKFSYFKFVFHQKIHKKSLNDSDFWRFVYPNRCFTHPKPPQFFTTIIIHISLFLRNIKIFV